MNKTVYLPDDEVEVWEKARRLANDRLSPVILRALKEFIMTKEAEAAEAAGFERIEVAFDDATDNGLPKRKAFYGRWIIPPETPLTLWDDGGAEGDHYCVAVTAKNNVVILSWTEGVDRGEGYVSHKRFSVYPSFAKAAADQLVNPAAREAIRKLGVPVEELDI
jgi:hypothetical protein